MTFVTLFAGEIDKDFQKTVNKYYPCKYGSMELGLSNEGVLPDFKFQLKLDFSLIIIFDFYFFCTDFIA